MKLYRKDWDGGWTEIDPAPPLWLRILENLIHFFGRHEHFNAGFCTECAKPELTLKGKKAEMAISEQKLQEAMKSFETDQYIK